ncbi:alpha/beta hydrolase fold domain-containing protein [Dermatophilus congolensis]|uniref:alpha/beta hydrolase fold domain-containing protein n=1 Tax=Dermatophilus congolensis TaxID=1863 RepID=UPI001AB02D4B|nr:alpha/beta hydrolase [Dermatophilus congolensis]
MSTAPPRRVRAVAALAGILLTSACAVPLTPQEYASQHPTVTAQPTPITPQHLLDQPYVAKGDPRQRLDLTVPPGQKGRIPVVMFIHGGAWSGGDPRSFESSKNANFAALRSALLAQGWATASIGYRLTPGAVMPAQLHDVKAATRWLHAHAGRYGLDPQRIAVIGESAGGHLAQLLGTTRGNPSAEGTIGITKASSSVAAVVSLYGVSDLITLVKHRVDAGCGPGDHGPDSPEGKLIGGKDPADAANADAADAASPITQTSRNSAPTLFLHGTHDCIVPQAQSERAATALRNNQVNTEVHLIDAGHADPTFYTTPEIRAHIITFLKHHFTTPTNR